MQCHGGGRIGSQPTLAFAGTCSWFLGGDACHLLADMTIEIFPHQPADRARRKAVMTDRADYLADRRTVTELRA